MNKFFSERPLLPSERKSSKLSELMRSSDIPPPPPSSSQYKSPVKSGGSSNQGGEDEEEEDGQPYCICRSTDCSTFMICCDNCEEWYHGHCINVKEEEAKYIKHFYCSLCRKQNPKLEIKYKHKKLKDKRDKHDRHEKRDREEKRERDEKRERREEKQKHRDRDKHEKHRSEKSEAHSSVKSAGGSSSKREKMEKKHKDRESLSSKHDKHHRDKHHHKRDKHDKHRSKDRQRDKEREGSTGEREGSKHREEKKKKHKHKHKEHSEKKHKKREEEANKHDNKHRRDRDLEIKQESGMGSSSGGSIVEEKYSAASKYTIKGSETKSKAPRIFSSSDEDDLDDAAENYTSGTSLKSATDTGKKEKDAGRRNVKEEIKQEVKEEVKSGGEEEDVSIVGSDIGGEGDAGKVSDVNMSVDEDEEAESMNTSSPRKATNSFVSASNTSSASTSSKRCGICTACQNNEDCGRCDHCKDMRKFGGKEKLKQKCRLRMCMNFNKSGSSKSAENIFDKLWKEDRSRKSLSTIPHHHDSEDSDDSKQEYKPPVIRDDEFEDDDDDDDEDFSFNENLFKSTVRKRGRPSEGSRPSDSDASPVKARKKYKRRENKNKTPKSENKPARGRGRPRIHRDSIGYDPPAGCRPTQVTHKQCLGPGCVEVAREGSKYCSDECGLKLAKQRIYKILPARIQQYQATSCVAEERNRDELEKIRQQQEDCKKKLLELDRKHQKLDVVVNRAKQLTIDDNYDVIDSGDEMELSMYCVTCGHEVNQRSAMKHMERCYSRCESQTCYGSVYKTKIEGSSMFCDYYSHQTQTYCKRLKVLCPEHTKDPKVGPDEVCGCPATKDLFTETNELCRAPKRKCNKHVSWEKVRRGQIDMERLRQWMNLDDLLEQERNIRTSMANRSGVIALMLHQTLNHDPKHPIIPPPLDKQPLLYVNT